MKCAVRGWFCREIRKAESKDEQLRPEERTEGTWEGGGDLKPRILSIRVRILILQAVTVLVEQRVPFRE